MPYGVLAEYRGRVAIITLDNPKKLNALTKDGFYQISKYMREIEEHDEVFITVLTGNGRFFSAYVGSYKSYKTKQSFFLMSSLEIQWRRYIHKSEGPCGC